MKYFALFLLFFGFFSCSSNQSSGKLPNTPEAVVLKWQEYVDKNMLDSARTLSMEQALGYINFLDSLSDTEPLEEEHNSMLNLTCTLQANGQAVCTYFFEDELGYKMPGRLILTKENEQWKVQSVEDVEMPESESDMETGEEGFAFPDSSEVDID